MDFDCIILLFLVCWVVILVCGVLGLLDGCSFELVVDFQAFVGECLCVGPVGSSGCDFFLGADFSH